MQSAHVGGSDDAKRATVFHRDTERDAVLDDVEGRSGKDLEFPPKVNKSGSAPSARRAPRPELLSL